jgi:hypothetical protein
MPLTMLGREMLDEGAALSDTAWRLHVEALIISTSRLHDLEVPKRLLERQSETHGDHPPAVAELIEHGWWEDRGDCWYIGLRFPQWQQSKAQVEHRRQINYAAQERKRAHDSGDHRKCLPGRPCASPADTSGDSTADTPADSTRSSEKSRREKNALEVAPTTAWPETRRVAP